MSSNRTCARDVTRQKLWADLYAHSLVTKHPAVPVAVQRGEAEAVADAALFAFDDRFPAPPDPDPNYEAPLYRRPSRLHIDAHEEA